MTMKDHTTSTTDVVDCCHCNQSVPDRPYPPSNDNDAWKIEAQSHRPGCAAVLSRSGSRPAPVAPKWVLGKEYPKGDPAWFEQPDRRY